MTDMLLYGVVGGGLLFLLFSFWGFIMILARLVGMFLSLQGWIRWGLLSVSTVAGIGAFTDSVQIAKEWGFPLSPASEEKVLNHTFGEPKSLPAAGSRFRALVIKVLDGDTLIINRLDRTLRIRLAAIDAPEEAQPYGPSATSRLEGFVLKQEVLVHVDSVDRYGRIVAHLYVPKYDNFHVNKALIETGAAWHYKRYSDSRVLSAAEENARNGRLGLWANASPVSPWDYRRTQ